MPGTRDWDVREDLAARAIRRIRDGAIDAAGVSGLARELSISERHLHRILIEEVGASPLQLARSRRAHAARTLIEQTDLTLADVAFAAGFGSVRQFGETMREEFGVAPSSLPRKVGSRLQPGNHPVAPLRDNPEQDAPHSDAQRSDERPSLALQLRTRAPYDVAGMRAFLAAHAIPGRDKVSGAQSTHAIDVAGGTAVAHIDWSAIREHRGHVLIPLQLTLPGLHDTMSAIASIRRMLDLDADPAQIAEALSADEILAPLVSQRPGLRLPGSRNPQEFALGTVLGQQVSLAAARTLQGRLAAHFAASEPLTARGIGTGQEHHSRHEFVSAPDLARIAATPIAVLREVIGLTEARATTLRAVAESLSSGLDLGPGADREHARRELLAIRGIGPWSVELIAMRALGDPDAYPAGDLILKKALGARNEREAQIAAEKWRPYRGYATQHLWAGFLAEQATRHHS